MAARYNSDLYWLIKGIIIWRPSFQFLEAVTCSVLLPLFGMSYWPVFIMIYLYNRHLKKLGLQ